MNWGQMVKEVGADGGVVENVGERTAKTKRTPTQDHRNSRNNKKKSGSSEVWVRKGDPAQRERGEKQCTALPEVKGGDSPVSATGGCARKQTGLDIMEERK